MDFVPSKNIPQPPQTNQAKNEPYEFHVMPSKFHQYLAVKRKKSLSRPLIIIVIALMVAAILGLGAYYLYLQMKQPAVNVNQPNLNETNVNLNQENVVNENLNIINEEAINEPENINENANANENLNLNENVNANENANGNENINNISGEANNNVNEPPFGSMSYGSSLDSDSDGLTDVEEDLYQTEKRKADTDGDGYSDGDELKNLFNPKEAGGATLQTSGLVNTYSNQLYKYEILYPASWLAKPEDQSLLAIIFLSSTEEDVHISLEENKDKMDLVNWYLSISANVDLGSLQSLTTKSGYSALVSPDKLTYYVQGIADPERIYVIHFNIGNKTEVDFLSTFIMMVNSFKEQPVF
ncbi:MAG: hypothetical protein NTZ49_02825 [Candidatus Parcubacteria bacterium]|nr:hypothetical protein [Candidatus Parcubacteria bacterium]